MSTYPALDVHGADAGLVLAAVDDYSPTAADEQGANQITVFFNSAARRDEAADAVRKALPDAAIASRDVDDEDWARRSQENLTPIAVGRITVTPPWFLSRPAPPTSSLPPPASITIVITPSMGFGTGHHATTRLCLQALQELDVTGKRVLDVGTGSGVLAISAARLGAADVVGIDVDPDAITSARENLDANREAGHVRFEKVDVRDMRLPTSDIVLANLTGAVLVQAADLLVSAVAPEGVLIVSGVQTHERDDVVRAFAGANLTWSEEEAGWVGLAFNFPGTIAV